jgi:uncharacterized protein (DUF433 family)
MQLPEFLSRDPDGEVRLTGHRIGLYTLIRELREGKSAEEIAAEYPALPPALVREVVAFCAANRAEVEAYADAYRADLEQQAAALPSPEVLRLRRLEGRLREVDRAHEGDPAWARLPLAEKLRRIEQADARGSERTPAGLPGR